MEGQEEDGSLEEAMHYGPAHVVWEDENFDSAEWCLENFDKYKGDHSDEDLAVVRRSLEELVNIPLTERCPEPEEYEGENPENYPPPVGSEMVKN
jgi:hypothetical protein